MAYGSKYGGSDSARKHIAKFTKVENSIIYIMKKRYPKGSRIVLWTFMTDIMEHSQQELSLEDFINTLIDIREKGIKIKWSWNLQSDIYPFIKIG